MFDIISTQQRFEKVIDFFKQEIATIRTDRATPDLLSGIKVDAYQTLTPLNQLANITITSNQNLLIQPWDQNIVKNIEKAISTSDLGLTPIIDGKQIRITLPSLTEERRQELKKILQQKSEKAKISLRVIREEINKKLKQNKKEGEITEDDYFKLQKKLQKMIDEYNQKIYQLSEKKDEDLTLD